MPPTKIYFDTHQWTNCVEARVPGWTLAGLTDLRAAMLAKINTGEIEFLGSQFHIQELSRIPEPYRRPIVQFFWDTVRWLVLKPTVDLARLEVAVGRALEANEPYVTFVEQQALKRISRDVAQFDALGQQVGAIAAHESADQERWRTQLRLDLPRRFPGMTPEQVTRDWWRNAPSILQDWANDYMAASQAHFGLSADRSTWPNPTSLPTIRAMIASSLARVFMQFAERRQVGDGDRHDSHHYAAASYADVFVSEDGALRDTLAQVPNNLVRVITFSDFAGMMGVARH